MRTFGLNSPISLGVLRPGRLILPVLLAAAVCWMQMLPAQAPATNATPAAVQTPPHRHKRATKAPAPQTAAQAVTAPTAPPAPEMPLWPANEKPVEASVTWDSHGLTISATNSSLQQILNDVATVTGSTVEGLESDQRIFGVYGPGNARDVLAELLQGTSYNVLMIGDQGEGTPREIVLSARSAAGITPAAANPNQSNDEDAETEDQPQQPPQPPFRPPFGHHAPPMRQQPGQPPQPNNPQ